MRTIKQTYEIEAPLEKVWAALVDPEIIKNWSGQSAKMSGIEGESFSLWGGDIHGKNIIVKEKQKLVQEWFGGDWEKPSLVTINVIGQKNHTTLTLLQENVPDEDADEIDEGWQQYYIGALRELVEENSMEE